jgi:delta24(24(1))-sterol reductase
VIYGRCLLTLPTGAVRRHEEKLDEEIELEFGGPVGTSIIMVFSHFLMLYLWICLHYYNGTPTPR